MRRQKRQSPSLKRHPSPRKPTPASQKSTNAASAARRRESLYPRHCHYRSKETRKLHLQLFLRQKSQSRHLIRPKLRRHLQNHSHLYLHQFLQQKLHPTPTARNGPKTERPVYWLFSTRAVGQITTVWAICTSVLTISAKSEESSVSPVFTITALRLVVAAVYPIIRACGLPVEPQWF